MKRLSVAVVLLALVAGCKMSTAPRASIERGGAKPNPIVIIKCDERAKPVPGRTGGLTMGNDPPRAAETMGNDPPRTKAASDPISKNAEPVIICDR